MSFPVAVQSAIFYVLACTPCMAARNRYRSKKRARREREARAQMEADEPPLYRHPSPFSQNPYWDEDIRMGPHLPKKGRAGANNKSSSQRKLASAGKDSSATHSSLAVSSNGAPNTADGTGVLVDNGMGTPANGTVTGTATVTPGIVVETANDPNVGKATGTTQTAGKPANSSADTSRKPASQEGNDNNAGNTSNTGNENNAGRNATPDGTTNGNTPAPASPTLLADDSHSMNMVETTVTATTTTTEGWNYKRYQREDEELWGSEQSRTHKLMDAIVKAGSSAGRLLESRLGKDRLVTEEDRVNFYAPTIVHPPVNEYHPPVVSNKPAHKEALRWMLQPPPPAKVMEGKVPVSRSTSIASSTASHGARRHPPPGSDVSLTRRMALEARLRRVNSNNSALASDGRAATPTSIDGAADGAFGGDANVLTMLGSSPSRTTPRKKGVRSRSQRATMQRNRSRSGSLTTSSMDDPTWSSDEEGDLNARWRFPLFASPSAAANSAEPLPEIPSKYADEHGDVNSDGLSRLGRARSSSNKGMSMAHPTMTAAMAMATVEARMANSQTRPKLDTIMSSGASGKGEAGPSDKTAKADGKDQKRKENLPLEPSSSKSNGASAEASASASDPKSQEPRSATSSVDSGLALST